MSLNRIIGQYIGNRRGPMLIVLGGIHGNEPAGVLAMETLFYLLEREPKVNPEFTFSGMFLGLRGNLKALELKRRFLETDMNRLWDDEEVERYLKTPDENLGPEEQEVKAIITIIRAEIESYDPERIIFMDLHTTTADGGIFSIPTEMPESLKIAVELHAPVIKGMLDGMQGTTLHYFKPENFEGRDITGVAFESGQHDDHLSVNRAIAAIINCMRTIGCVIPEQVENRHDKLLIEYSKDLPKVSELLMCHAIEEGDNFIMRPNFKNFQPVKKGQQLAEDNDGIITAEYDGLILMPLYQQQGDDGFFLIKPLRYGSE